MNLIKYRVVSSNLDCEQSDARDQSTTVKAQKSRKLIKRTGFLLMICCVIASSFLVMSAKNHKAEAATFGLGNDYNKILELNGRLSNSVPVSIEKISMSHTDGDKRVIALLIFLQKYKSPMASPSVAKAFVDSADKYGFGDRWALLPAISGIESGFGKITPYKHNQLSYNAWGWGGPGNWVYFNSWEDSADRISKGIAKGYGATNLNPERMMASYCPPCSKSGGLWAKVVIGYMAELNAIYKSL